ncbi:alpha/beta hydrolase fold protein [Thermodesulfobium narugense DSM 14796]|uniref:Alpha/beta hydrolase fold protein n=1 Tax=Thermodesulfobium narugense DSM 14796 TaxID=747365 RepID=M1E4E9_9BACT|nr:alpha/beta hydrolase [Thermodesulfobium narugense]AEE14082.1 alpha/beta hydrolase fold protein [Thermodesulfobium narugense DSM 14796]
MPSVKINNLETYYEIFGMGSECLILHGGSENIGTMYHLANRLVEKNYKVFLPERRGHGRSEDTSDEFSYEQFASDTYQFIKTFKLDGCFAVGYSDGAIILLLLAIKYPKLFKKIALLGGQYHYDGLEPYFIKALKSDNVLKLFEKERIEYERINKYRISFEKFLNKIILLWLTSPKIDYSDLEKITTPTLIISADRDLIKLEHTISMFKGIKSSHLAIIPDANHNFPISRPNFTANLILNFFNTKP